MMSRVDSLKETKRISLENNNIVGSISLTGGILDDITLKNYNQSLNSEEKVILLNPDTSKEGYYIESGWASGGDEKINLPMVDTDWKVLGNSTLTPNNPVTLEWNNGNGLIFLKK